jgi:hypothetical protein
MKYILKMTKTLHDYFLKNIDATALENFIRTMAFGKK